jgi:hypothetical protein
MSSAVAVKLEDDLVASSGEEGDAKLADAAGVKHNAVIKARKAAAEAHEKALWAVEEARQMAAEAKEMEEAYAEHAVKLQRKEDERADAARDEYIQQSGGFVDPYTGQSFEYEFIAVVDPTTGFTVLLREQNTIYFIHIGK